MDTIESTLNSTRSTLNSTRSTLNSTTSTLNSTRSTIASASTRGSSRLKQKSHCRAFKDTVNEYASSSSAHGISYIFESDRLGFERLLWIFVVGFALIFR